MGRALCILIGTALVFWLAAPKPSTIIDVLAVVWVLYASLYVLLWLCGKFVMSAVRKGIRDGTLKFTVKTTDEKDEGNEQ